MGDRVFLRPVAEDDLPLLYRLTSDPSATGQHEWFGWRDPGRFRRQWAENGLLSDDGGILIVAAGDERVGFVSWRKHLIAGLRTAGSSVRRSLPRPGDEGLAPRRSDNSPGTCSRTRR